MFNINKLNEWRIGERIIVHGTVGWIRNCVGLVALVGWSKMKYARCCYRAVTCTIIILSRGVGTRINCCTEIYKYKYTEEEKGKMGETQDKNQWRNGMLDVVEAEQSQLWMQLYPVCSIYHHPNGSRCYLRQRYSLFDFEKGLILIASRPTSTQDWCLMLLLLLLLPNWFRSLVGDR